MVMHLRRVREIDAVYLRSYARGDVFDLHEIPFLEKSGVGVVIRWTRCPAAAAWSGTGGGWHGTGRGDGRRRGAQGDFAAALGRPVAFEQDHLHPGGAEER